MVIKRLDETKFRAVAICEDCDCFFVERLCASTAFFVSCFLGCFFQANFVSCPLQTFANIYFVGIVVLLLVNSSSYIGVFGFGVFSSICLDEYDKIAVREYIRFCPLKIA